MLAGASNLLEKQGKLFGSSFNISGLKFHYLACIYMRELHLQGVSIFLTQRNFLFSGDSSEICYLFECEIAHLRTQI